MSTSNSTKSVLVLSWFEFKKVVKRRVALFYVLAILITVIVAASWLSDKDVLDSYTDDWRNELQQLIDQNNEYLSQGVSGSGKEALISENTLYQWYLDNDIRPYDIKSAPGFLQYVNTFFPIVIILSIIIACYLIVDEFNNKKALGLYTMPIKRYKILFSKFVALLICIVIISIIFLLFSIMAGWLFFGFSSINVPYVYIVNGRFVVTNVLTYSIMQIGLNILALLFCVSIAVFFGIAFKSTVFGSVLGILLYYLGNVFSVLLISMYSWFKWLPFINMDLHYYFDNSFVFPGSMNPLSSILLLLGYTTAFIVSTFVINSKQDL